MLTLLAKIFIKDYKSYNLKEVRQKYGILCGIIGIFFNLLLFGGKLFVGIISGSIAATADAFNNLSDAASSLITAAGFKLSGQKPDIRHPFGHGRIEYISGLIVSLLIMLVGIELFKSSIEKIIHPVDVKFSITAIIIMAVSICVKIYMAFYNSRIGKKMNSAAMKAVSKDSLSDCIATLAVLLSMIIMDATGIHTDGWFGLLVALFVLYAGFSSVRDTINPLLGQPPDEKFVKEIKQIVLSHEEIVGVHDLIVHDYGPGRQMVSLHAEVLQEVDIIVMHDIIDNIEKELFNKIGCQAVIHMDPISTSDEKTLETKKVVESLVKKIDERITLHDFRMVPGPTHTNVIFDIVVPYDIKKSETELKNEVILLVKEFDKTLYAVVEIDRPHS